jgi:hypothetical protein
MDCVNPVEEQIEAALASGELTPTRGVGEPFDRLDNDQAWWPRSFLRREQAADQLVDVRANRVRRFAQAVHAADFNEAREILASLNAELVAWNDRVDEEHRLAPIGEITLLNERENARR